MGATTTDLIHVAWIDGHAVRFYKIPSRGGSEPPWVALADIHLSMGQSDQDLALWTERLAGSDDAITVSTDVGPVLIVSHLLASSATAGLVSARRAPLSLVQLYGVAFSEAVDVLLGDLPAEEAAARKQRWLSESFDFGNAPKAPEGGKLS